VISRTKILYFLITIYLIFPIVISFVFKVLNLSIPTYLFIFFIIIFFTFSSLNKIPSILIKYDNKNWHFYFLLFWLVFGYFYSPSIIAKNFKILLIFYDIIFPILLIGIYVWIGKLNFSFRSFELYILKYTYLVIWLVFFFFLLFSLHDESGRYYLPGSENSILFSRNISAYLIILYYVDHKVSPLLKWGSILVGLIMLFASSSKGPMLALFIVFILIYNSKISKSAIIKNIYFLVVILLILVIVSLFDNNNYLFDTNFYSLYARQDYIRLVYDNFNFNLLTGIGTGAFSIFFFDEDSINYPHNIFLELFIENGLIGLGIFLLVIRSFINNYNVGLFSLLAVFYFISAQFSGDIPGNNYVFILYFLIILTKPFNLKVISIEK
jgi:hypothetical protein